MSQQLIQAYANHFLSGQGFTTIVAARKFAESVLGVSISPGTAFAKQVDEALEAAIVRVASTVVQQADTTHAAYDSLVNLLHRQPNLSVRSSTSVLQQAYSTPLPIAYLASVLAGITPETTIYEPTAGNGALLMAAHPNRVMANEINGDRFTELATRGYHQLTQNDALTYKPDTLVDCVICNPPFGSILDAHHHTQRFRMADTWTTQIDQVIALKALEVMKDNGRATLILGGKLGSDEVLRSDRYNTRESRAFFYLLYQQYTVTQHFSIWGDLYRKNGAGFPIDVIVIAGRGKSPRLLPAAEVPVIYKSFTELKEQLPNESLRHQSSPLDTAHGPLRNLHQTLGTPAAALPIRRQGAQSSQESGGKQLRNADDESRRLDDSTLDREWSQPGKHPKIASYNIESAKFPSETPLFESERSRKFQPLGMADELGRSLDSLQRALHRKSVVTGHGRNQFPGQALNAEASRLREAPGNPSGNGSGNLADRANPLQLGVRAGDTMDKSSRPDEYSQSRQVPYMPKSRGISTQTLIPCNMASAAQVALDRFEQQHGNIDEYLATRLGYASVAELHHYFSAEQVDASALAISNIEREAGFITGDQTGIGKGRICASIMRYAQQQGKIPLFVTKDKPLYADMMRDVADIGMGRFRPFITDSNIEIPLANGGVLKTGRTSQQDNEMLEMMRSGRVNHYHAIFTTYSQLQTVGKKEPLRRDFLRALAPNAILILDEAHQAGGSQNGWKESGPPDRAEFVRELVDLSAGVFYSSATYAKRPDVMDLYARRTDLRLGVSNMATLETLLTRGGVPLQQIVASKFVASGQMLRRERSYEGIGFEAKVVPVDREVADQFSAAMRAIKDFDRVKQKALKEISKQLKQEAKQLGEDGAVGEVGAKSTNFTSLMHNCIEQGLLAQKAEATVEAAIESLQSGQKPVITVANTMGSFIQSYAELNDLKQGDTVNLSFGDLLERYLERSRDVTVRDYRGEMNRYRLSDQQLGIAAVNAYEDALECIRSSDFSGIPISPIDYIEQQLERAGYRITEVTGRKAGIDYAADGSMTYKVRPDQETTARAKIDAVARFNAGDVDVILLNCSGSTGISLHASEKFADQRPRHMIVAQAERDINVFMQMLGRVHRTGQVVLPSYTLLMGDIPAEKRPGAILCRKLATLNANTTAARETDISISNVVDFMNPYGEQVIAELLLDDPELNAQLDFPTAQAENDTSDIALIKKVTGRIPLLPIAAQEEVYTLIETEYQELVDQARAMGENILEADQLDLDARPLARMAVIPDDSQIQSEFTGGVFLEVVDAKSQTKPLTQLQAVNAMREELGLEAVKTLAEHDRDRVGEIAQAKMTEAIAQLHTTTQQYRQDMVARKEEESAIVKFNEKLDQQLQQVTRVLEEYPPGTPIRLATPINQSIFYGVVAGIDQKRRSGSPAAPNSWKIRILVADSARQVTVPLSKFNSGREGSVTANVQTEDWFGNEVYSLFDQQQATARINRQIFTGNLIKAFEKYPNGKLINYTDDQGTVRQGLMMPKGFDIQEEVAKEPVVFREPEQVKAFITELTDRQGAVKTLDELLILKAQRNGPGFLLQTPAAKESGGKYFLDEQLIAAAGSDFYSVSGRMEVVIPPERLEQTLNVLMHQRHYSLATFDMKEIARNYLDIKLPTLETIEPRVPEPRALGTISVQNNPEMINRSVELTTESETQKTAEEDREVVPSKSKNDDLEKRIVRFLKTAGIYSAIMESDEFHLKIENEPFIPLVVERQGNTLYLTHYLSQNGDIFIDAEMVFQIRLDGQLKFQETAVQDPIRGGELRFPDRPFAHMFSRNILDQGFAEAARRQVEVRPLEPQSQPASEVIIAPSLFDLNPFITPADSRTAPSGNDPTWRLSEPPTTSPAERDTDGDGLSDAVEQSIGTSIYHADTDGDGLSDRQEIQSNLDPLRVDTDGAGITDGAERTDRVPHPPPPPRIVPHLPNLKELADQVRELDLAAVAVELGLKQDCHDKHKWRDAGHIISISHGKFMDWLADQGGGGAIDLVMHVQHVDFKAAVQWLSGQTLMPRTTYPTWQAEETEPRTLKMPEPDQRRWDSVRQYLTETRKLSPVLVDRLRDRGLIYADLMQNAVFVRHALKGQGTQWQRGEPTGANLRGTWGEHNAFHGLAPGSAREQGWFWLGLGKGEIQRVWLTESAIDALSLAMLDKHRSQSPGATVYLSTDGAGAIPLEALKHVMARGGQVFVAFDGDPPGEAMAWRVAQQLPGVKRLTPAYGKDWNERLVQDGHPEQATRPDRDKQLLHSLWHWHQVARELGKSENYLSRITEVAREVARGVPLSDKAKVAMQQDLQAAQLRGTAQVAQRQDKAVKEIEVSQ